MTTNEAAKAIRSALKTASIRASVRSAGEWIDVTLTTSAPAAIREASSIAESVAGFYRVSVTGPNGGCGLAA